MSYILDALRRADAERDRGAVPGLHAQPVALGELDVEARRPARTGLWAIVVVLALLVSAGAWWLLGNAEPPRAGSGAGVVTPPPAAVSPPAAPVNAVAPVTAAPAAAQPPSVAATPRPAPADVPPAARKPLPKPATAAATRPAPATSTASTPAASSPSATDPRVYQLSELPDDIRRELPTLAIGGAMYSPNPANRMLIVNGQTFHEGDKLAPNLSLEQIRLKSALLEYKGYRYRITY